MGGKDGSPGGGVPANELWWRIPLAVLMMAIGIAAMLSPLLLADYLVNGKL